MHTMLVICGPTATGKTALALHLAKKYNGELVSADSRQIYKGMDIGTGKDVQDNYKLEITNYEFLSKDKHYTIPQYKIDSIPLWMYDVVTPDEAFSVSHYQNIGRQVIADITSRGKLPIVVGGTGLYIQSLVRSIETAHIPPNAHLRTELASLNIQELGARLQKEAPVVWNTLNNSERNNPRRLIRKIEIAMWRGKAISHQLSDKKMREEEDICIVGLTAPFDMLYQRIDARVEKRVEEGIEKEIQTLLTKGYTWDLPSMNTFGYKEWKEYFNTSPLTRSVVIPSIIQRWKYDEHAYARRQMTWFRKQQGIQWFDIQDPALSSSVEQVVSAWYNMSTYAHKS